MAQDSRKHRYTNPLIREKSPYLLQHAHNPVDWYPWGEEAFEKAKDEDRPVFLSIGYSTCHWCHVMERESFEDPEVAELLNRHFVSIKVDREERPDVDHLYMRVCQGMTGQGGWPLTVFMTPEKEPFFSGTYFPKQSRHGRHGLMDLLQRTADLWKTDRDRLRQTGRDVVRKLTTGMHPAARGEVNNGAMALAFDYVRSRYDETYGGFGGAPKFPRPHELMFLLRFYARTGREDALNMVEGNLRGMWRGGIYDHLGYGFSRYATDKLWLIPHFEKMLYDNALLALAYLEGYQAAGTSRWAQVAQEIFSYVLRDMTSPEGGFYSAEDADTEGKEGQFYVWTPDDICRVLGEEAGRMACRYYGVTEEGNFERGTSVLHTIDTDSEAVAREFGLAPEVLEERMEQARRKLWEAREGRERPHKDDKILTAWNGLMIAAFSRGYRVLGDPRYLSAACRAASWLWKAMRRNDGRLLARYRDGDAGIPGYLDDYAFYIWGLLELYQASGEVEWVVKAEELAEDVWGLFWDDESGGCFLTGSDAESLWARPKVSHDGMMPSGNAVFAMDMLWLARMTGNTRWEERADAQLKALAGEVERFPAAHTFLLSAWDIALGPSQEVVVVGEREDPEQERLLAEVRSLFLPRAVWIAKPADAEGERMAEAIPWLKEYRLQNGRTTVYLCRGFACEQPVGADQAAARLREIACERVE
ncbi:MULTISPECIES: thioredoxin domain-containing protein [unclassified Paenibacillus]|uniref:thioredoxin domain-containing protein n=1 Tax=unclassified Paenibacillus TaxID=185978 RepID=UPI0021195415|nr:MULTISPECIES: thioredoxin domain-containing protein [unclassified Paenibacillus]